MNDLVRHVDLGNGASLTIRRTHASDRALLRSLFHELSTEDRYLRFFSPFDPGDEFLDRLAAANENGAIQLIAITERDGEPDEVTGEAGAWPRPNGNAELAITVRPNARGWLGPYLLDALIEMSRAAGIPNLEAEVLITNRRMLALLRPRGYAASGHDGFHSGRFVISTSGATPSWPETDDRPRLLVEAAGARWDGEDTAKEDGVQLMVCPGPLGRASRRCPVLEGGHCPLADGADAIVMHLGEPVNAELAGAHARLTPAVPVCVHPIGTSAFDVVKDAVHAAKEHHRS